MLIIIRRQRREITNDSKEGRGKNPKDNQYTFQKKTLELIRFY